MQLGWFFGLLFPPRETILQFADATSCKTLLWWLCFLTYVK